MQESGLGGAVASMPAVQGLSSSMLWPDDLLARARAVPGKQWLLVYTRSRQEKAVAERLAASGVDHYLPLVKRKSLSRGRLRVAHVPLFSGYVFVFGGDEDRLAALKTNKISTTNWVAEGDKLCSDLLRIEELIELGAPLTPEARIEKGHWVRVRSGPFVGVEGVVIRRQGQTRLFVAVDYLQQGASLEIPDYQLEPL